MSYEICLVYINVILFFRNRYKKKTFHLYLLFSDLDLDYLARRAGDTITNDNGDSGTKEEESPADSLDRVKVVFLGAPAVGKSSIIRVSQYLLIKKKIYD